MTYIIAEPCVGVKDGTCADVCPVECIHTDADADMYFIDPYECIDCGICVAECPVGAIYPDRGRPDEWGRFAWINSGFFGPHGGLSGAPVPRRGLPPSHQGGAAAHPDGGPHN